MRRRMAGLVAITTTGFLLSGLPSMPFRNFIEFGG